MKKVIISQLSIQKESVEQFLKMATLMVKESNAELGCITYKLLYEYETSNEFVIYEEFVSEQALELHKSSQHFKDFLGEVMPILMKEPTMQMY